MPHVLLLVVLLLTGCGEELPKGTAGPDADAMARRMTESVNVDAWRRTNVVSFSFDGRRTHLWDRRRRLARVSKDGLEIYIDLRSRAGVAFEDGAELAGEARDEALQSGYEMWANDTFWLTAMNKAFDPGTSRYRVATEHGDALLVRYASGGVTPGDAYLWHFDDAGRPVSWQLWVSKIPVDGVQVSWEGWTELPTGAWVSTRHTSGVITFGINDLRAGETIAEVVDGPDPFQQVGLPESR